MLLLRSAGAVLAVHARRRRQGRILHHLRVRRQVLAVRVRAVRLILRPRLPRNPILHLPHRQVGHLAVRVLVLQVLAQALGRFLVVRAVRHRLPPSAAHRAVPLQKAMVSRAKRPTVDKRIPTKAAPTPLAIAVQAP